MSHEISAWDEEHQEMVTVQRIPKKRWVGPLTAAGQARRDRQVGNRILLVLALAVIVLCVVTSLG